MTSTFFSLAVSIFSIVATPAIAPAQIDQLGWMAGSWASDSAGVRIEEHWMAPRGGTMIGMHRDVIPGRAVGIEYFRIETDEAGLVYLSSPQGQPPTPFRSKQIEAQRVVFENAEHDFPQRILYWLGEGGELHARIEGTIDGKEQSADWVWTKDRLDPR